MYYKRYPEEISIKVFFMRIILILLAILIIAGGIRHFFAGSGRLIPKSISFKDYIEAQDYGGKAPIESVVLKNQKLTVYFDGKELFQSANTMKVQDVIWQDINSDGVRELVFLSWEKYTDEMNFFEKLFSNPYRQFLYVYDGVSSGMNELLRSEAIDMTAVAIYINEENKIVLDSGDGRQKLF